MNSAQQESWKDGILRLLLEAVAADKSLREALIFKGARILNMYLGSHRQSLDLDSSLSVDFHQKLSDRDEQIEWFRDHLERALHRYFEDQDPVRYKLESVNVRKNPPRLPHPRGWDMLVAEIRIADERMKGVRGLPIVELEIAAPESLGEFALCELPVNEHTVLAYSLERIAGEKLRAFLTSLPAYREKMGGGDRVVRAKDLHDLARILEARPLENQAFWQAASEEFRLACESRYVDCSGPEVFKDGWAVTQTAYETDATLTAVLWHEAEQALDRVLDCFEQWGVFPLVFPLSERGASGEKIF